MIEHRPGDEERRSRWLPASVIAVFALVVAVEEHSSHPVARALIAGCGPPSKRPVTEVESHAGRGLTAIVGGRRVIKARRAKGRKRLSA